jgi:hypothetical protein
MAAWQYPAASKMALKLGVKARVKYTKMRHGNGEESGEMPMAVMA